MSYLEASLKCSPNNYVWFSGFPVFDIGGHDILNYPICQSFCDSFYEACKDQNLCTTVSTGSEWIAGGFSMACDSDQCPTYSEFFENGKLNYDDAARAEFLCKNFVTLAKVLHSFSKYVILLKCILEGNWVIKCFLWFLLSVFVVESSWNFKYSIINAHFNLWLSSSWEH